MRHLSPPSGPLRSSNFRLLLACDVISATGTAVATVALPSAVLATAFLTGGCAEVFSVNWATAMQQEIPPAMLSRLSSYDALGSFALAPAGTAVAGPLAGSFGTPAVLAAGAILIVALTAAVLLVPDVRHLERKAPAGSDQHGGLAS